MHTLLMEHLSIEGIARELSVLAKAVDYKNLSGAAANIGISQPQLSRIIHKLEEELSGSLLDRSSRRKSAWTPLAHQLAQAYLQSQRGLNAEVLKLLEGHVPKFLRFGTLEGLVPLAMKFVHPLLTDSPVTMLDIDVYDLNQLEELFFRGDLDVIFTIREPGRKKYPMSRQLGYQSLELVEHADPVRVVSTFEYGSQVAPAPRKRRARSQGPETPETGPATRTLISNSLAVRRHWLEEYGGTGTIPLDVRSSKKSPVRATGRRVVREEEVYLCAQDAFSPGIWTMIEAIKI